MKILHITTHLNKGGITSYLFSLATGLKAKGHAVIIASSGGQSQEEFVKSGIKCIFIPIYTKKEISPSVLFSYLALRRFLSEEKIDVIHAHTRVTQVLAVSLSRKFRIPLVTTCHGFFKSRWHRRVFPCWGDKTIAISSQVKNHLINDFKVKREDVYLIHNGINPDKFKRHSLEEIEELKKEASLPKNCIIVGSVARFSTVKGLEYFIKALPLVAREYNNAMFLLVGYGAEETSLKQIAKDLKIEDKIVFFNPIKDSYKYLPVMDIFVMPSIQEGLGLSILEAQAQGIPVIASRVGGIPDIIEDNVTGILVESKNSGEIAAAILKLIKDKNLAAAIKDHAYERTVSDFSLEKMVEKTESVYKEIVHAV